MLNNIDPAQFDKGFEAGLNKIAEGLWHDLGYNISHPVDSFKNWGYSLLRDGAVALGNDPQVKNMIQGHAASAGQNFTNGALSGAQQAIGYDPNKGLGENMMGMAKQHPIMAGIGAAGTLFGGYQLGKSFGLWGDQGNAGGGNNSNQMKEPSNDLGPAPGPKNNFSSAYTSSAPRAPQALQKAGSSFNVTDGVRMNVSDLTLPRSFSAPTAIGMNLVSMMAGDEDIPDPTPAPTNGQFNVTGHDDKAKQLLAHPKMKAYIANLMQRSYQ